MHPSERIRERMDALGLKQKDLIAALGISRGSASAWVNGTGVPINENLLDLAKLLRVNPRWILTGKEEKEKIHKVDVDIIKKATRLVKHSEMLSNKELSAEEFSDKVVDVCFRIDSGKHYKDLIKSMPSDSEPLKQAGIEARKLLKKIVKSSPKALSESKQDAIYAELIDQIFSSYLETGTISSLDVSNYIK
jgi:transcriptional regulator with XRE-family HTH domain